MCFEAHHCIVNLCVHYKSLLQFRRNQFQVTCLFVPWTSQKQNYEYKSSGGDREIVASGVIMDGMSRFVVAKTQPHLVKSHKNQYGVQLFKILMKQTL